MSAAAEYINDFLDVRPPDSGVGLSARTESTSGAVDIRLGVRAGLMDALEFRSGESVTHLSEIGGTSPGDGEFDVITADLDVVHRAGPEQVASDLLRRCRPGGRIGIACPVPGSFLAQVQQSIERFVSQSGFSAQPGFVGTRENLNAHFGQQASALGACDRVVKLYCASPEHWLAGWQSSYAPLQAAYRLVDPERRNEFSEDLIELAKRFTDVDADGRFIRCDYLEFLVHKSELQ
jgi:SAM-dependent methyltransferase